MATNVASNITWHQGNINQNDRESLLNQKGVVLWYTGLSGSGKSTLANAVEERLYQRGRLTYMLDGDNVRHGLNKNLGFSPEDRTENIRRIGEVAKLFCDAGAIVMTAFISPYKKDRRAARALVESGKFIEIYCAADLKSCEQRDPKGLYEKARSGQIRQFTGVDAPYEIPEHPELAIPTHRISLEDSVDWVIAYLEGREIIPSERDSQQSAG
ncbi:MAG: adenylyl-sulfate kinase [Deltaproteobacteria bacterium]|nr:adenylyl-sulfate kinase [Deltaproteobacteria bacterium]